MVCLKRAAAKTEIVARWSGVECRDKKQSMKKYRHKSVRFIEPVRRAAAHSTAIFQKRSLKSVLESLLDAGESSRPPLVREKAAPRTIYLFKVGPVSDAVVQYVPPGPLGGSPTLRSQQTFVITVPENLTSLDNSQRANFLNALTRLSKPVLLATAAGHVKEWSERIRRNGGAVSVEAVGLVQLEIDSYNERWKHLDNGKTWEQIVLHTNADSPERLYQSALKAVGMQARSGVTSCQSLFAGNR